MRGRERLEGRVQSRGGAPGLFYTQWPPPKAHSSPQAVHREQALDVSGRDRARHTVVEVGFRVREAINHRRHPTASFRLSSFSRCSGRREPRSGMLKVERGSGVHWVPSWGAPSRRPQTPGDRAFTECNEEGNDEDSSERAPSLAEHATLLLQRRRVLGVRDGTIHRRPAQLRFELVQQRRHLRPQRFPRGMIE
jgi:hypothetical protein